MRILLAHYLPLPDLIKRRALPGFEHEIMTLGSPPHPVSFDPERNTLEEIIARLPGGWAPDLYIHWSLEYNAVPGGIENAPFATAATIGDWNVGGQSSWAVGGAFDLLVADLPGCERLRSAGHQAVAHGLLWGYDPDVHRNLGFSERTTDIAFAGSFNHDMQAERASYLARVARLSDRYRVQVTAGVFGDEYTSLLNRARIVFNRSIRGELNMRAYEAAACGALMFIERGNEEAGLVFEDGVSCVFYGEDDLEDRLIYYLEHEEERARIAAAGQRAVQDYTYPLQLERTLRTVVSELEAGQGSGRPFNRLSASERAGRAMVHFLALPDRRNALAALRLAGAAQNGLARSVRALAGAELAQATGNEENRQNAYAEAMAEAKRAVEALPESPLARLNLAQMFSDQRDYRGAEGALEAALNLLDSPVEDWQAAFALPTFPRCYAAFDVALERAWLSAEPGSSQWMEAVSKAFRWRAWTLLVECRRRSGRHAEAIEAARAAADLMPNESGGHTALARVYRFLGRAEEAVEAYRQSLRLQPFQEEASRELAELLRDLGRVDECRDSVREALRIVNGAPPCEAWREPLVAILRSLVYERLSRSTFQPYRFLAIPKWGEDGDWEEVLGSYAQAFNSEDMVTLKLYCDVGDAEETQSVVRQIEAFLARCFTGPPEQLPDIELDFNLPPAEDRWMLFRAVDAAIGGAGFPYAHLAEAAGIPVLAPSQLAAKRVRLAKAA